MKNTYKTSTGRPKGKSNLDDVGIGRRIINRMGKYIVDSSGSERDQ
jgi:hypothetical protein